MPSIDWKSFIAGILAYMFIWPLISRLIGGIGGKKAAATS